MKDWDKGGEQMRKRNTEAVKRNSDGKKSKPRGKTVVREESNSERKE